MEVASAEANLFEGMEDRKLPIYSAEGIHSRLFQLVGKMVAYLIFHLDIGVPCFSPAAYHYIASGSLETAAGYCCLDDVNDYEARDVITKVRKTLFDHNQKFVFNTS